MRGEGGERWSAARRDVRGVEGRSGREAVSALFLFFAAPPTIILRGSRVTAVNEGARSEVTCAREREG